MEQEGIMLAVMYGMTADEISAVVSGKRSAILMKKKPKLLNTPFIVYLYEKRGCLRNIPKIGYTHYRYDGRGAVVAECICHTVTRTNADGMYDNDLNRMLCMPMREICERLEGKPGYVWQIEDVKIYEEPKPIEDFGKNAPPNEWCYVERRMQNEQQRQDSE